MKINLTKQDNGSFLPTFNSDYDKAKKIKTGESFDYEYKKIRNILFHRKFFALINMVYENQDKYNNIEHLRRDLTIASGFYEQHETFTGQIRTEPKSISFAKMSQDDFDKFYSAFIVSINKYFDFGESEIKENIEQFY